MYLNKIFIKLYGAFIISLNLVICMADESCLAKIDEGSAIGLNDLNVNGNRMCSYFGIPYAEPPIGELRFEHPIPFKWFGTKNFIEKADKCPQFAIDGTLEAKVDGTEDCLYLNVYTPLLANQTELLPVFFWIHGGSFAAGSAFTDHNGFDNIVEQNIIVVSINYRLGPLGFLSVPSLNISGNLGMKDQVVALKWVQRNIEGFGGDPKKVTIVGWSAGAASVTYHMYSKQSHGLFQRAIAMSGTFLNPFAYLEASSWCGRNYLDFVGLHTKKQLKTANFVDLMPQFRSSLMFSYFGHYHFCFIPTIEPSWQKHRYLKNSPIEMIQHRNNISLMIGYTALEFEIAHRAVRYFMSNFNFPNMDENINTAVETYIKNFTEQHFEFEDDEQLFMLQMNSMSNLLYGVREFMDIYTEKTNSRVYAYQFSFDGAFGNYQNMNHKRWSYIRGASHGDDLGYLFVPFYKNNGTKDISKEKHVSKQVVEMWTNFVKYGDPTPTTNELITTKWRPYNDAAEILNINNTLKMEKIENSLQFELWDSVYKCLHKFECSFLEQNLTETLM